MAITEVVVMVVVMEVVMEVVAAAVVPKLSAAGMLVALAGKLQHSPAKSPSSLWYVQRRLRIKRM